MSEEERKRRVTNLAEYRKQRIQKAMRYKKDPAKILDEVSYYLLMAARAMSNHINK